MANFVISVYIIARANLFFLVYNRQGTVRRPADLLQRKRKFLKVVRCAGDYQFRR